MEYCSIGASRITRMSTRESSSRGDRTSTRSAVVDRATTVPVVALSAVLTESTGRVMTTAYTYAATATSRQQEQLGVETTPPRMRVTVARCTNQSHYLITAHAVNCGRFSFWRRRSVFFVCVWNISGTAEGICAKFTRKACLVPRSDEFEGKGQMSRSPGTKHGIFRPFRRPACGLCLAKHL